MGRGRERRGREREEVGRGVQDGVHPFFPSMLVCYTHISMYSRPARRSAV